MLEKDNCLMFKALLGLIQSQNYQIGSLFAMIDAATGNSLSEESREAFKKAVESLKNNIEQMQYALDQLMENEEVDAERLITDLPESFN
jgi:NAD(P)H-hydrate repair Nnr-like enzyme with NAD(P)H-hydrate epimerase domain